MSPAAEEIVAATPAPKRETAGNIKHIKGDTFENVQNNDADADAYVDADAVANGQNSIQPIVHYEQPKSSSSSSSLSSSSSSSATTPTPTTKPEVPLIGSSKVGSETLFMTPEQIAEAFENALREREQQRQAAAEKEEEDKNNNKSKYDFSLRSIWKSVVSIPDGLLLIVGKFLRFILRLDMHGGSTGDNIKFVEGLIDFLAGSLGGAAQVYVSQPLDTVKVKLQTFPEKYKGMFDCFVKTYQRDGALRGLYAGSVPAVVANVAENSVLFAAYGGCQKFVTYMVGKELPTDLTTVENACAGSFAACFSTLTLCPTELIKCKLQALREMKNFVEPSQTADIRTPWTLTRHIWRTEGIRGFYRGLGSTFIREMPGYFFFFGSYEGTRELLRKENQSKDEIGPVRTMLAGAIGGVCLWTSTFPADVIKSRIQVKNLNEGMFTVGADIVRREGFLALYRGLLPSVLRTIPATATLFVVYEYTKKAMHGTL